MKELSRKNLMGILDRSGPITDAQRNGIVCALIGHSKTQTYCFGYHNCARCGAQLGDSLAGAYSAEKVVLVGHEGGNCPTCHANYEKLTWRDKIFTPDPFVAE